MFRHIRLIAPAATLVALALASPASALNAAHPTVVSATPATGTPNVLDGVVRAVVQVGDEVVVGGSFTQVKTPGGATLARSNIFAFNPATGAVDPNFAPVIAGGEVSTLAAAPDGKSVYAGGEFQTVNGVAPKRLVKLTLATGLPETAFHAAISGSWVETMVVHGGDLYIGGAFSSVNSVTRGRFAAVDLVTGAVDPNVAVNFAVKRQGTLRVAHMAINPAGTRIVATGTFLQADGLDRAQIAMLDLTTTPVSVSSWETDRFKSACSTHFDTYLRGVDFSPDGSYFVVADTGAWFGGPNAGVLCDSASRWEANATGSGQQPTWVDYTGGDSLTQVAVTGAAVYVGGHQRWQNNPFSGDALGPGGIARMGIAALDPVNGMPLPWNPGRHPRGSGVWALQSTADGLWVGSDTDYIDGIYHAKLALMPLAGGQAIARPQPGSLPGVLVTLGSGDPAARSFDGATLGSASAVTGSGIDWTHVRGAFMLGNRLYTGWDNGQLLVRSFDGSTFGAATAVALNGLTSAQFPVASLTGMFYDTATGRLYYTVSGDTHLYYRYFEPDGDTIGAQTFVAGNGGIDWSHVSGMTMAGGQIYYRTSGPGSVVSRVAFTAGAPVAGTQATIASASGWSARGMFVVSH